MNLLGQVVQWCTLLEHVEAMEVECCLGRSAGQDPRVVLALDRDFLADPLVPIPTCALDQHMRVESGSSVAGTGHGTTHLSDSLAQPLDAARPPLFP